MPNDLNYLTAPAAGEVTLGGDGASRKLRGLEDRASLATFSPHLHGGERWLSRRRGFGGGGGRVWMVAAAAGRGRGQRWRWAAARFHEAVRVFAIGQEGGCRFSWVMQLAGSVRWAWQHGQYRSAKNSQLGRIGHES